MPQDNPRVYLNRVNGSSATDGQFSGQFVEMAFVDQIATGSPSAVKSLALSAPGIPQKGDSHLSVARSVCIERKAEPVGDSQCWVRIVYETASGTIANTWVVSDNAVLAPQITQLFPDTWERIRVTWVNPKDKTQVVDETATIAFARPTRSLVAEGEIAGRPSESWFDAIGTVNDRQFHGKRKGYWLCSGVETSTKSQGARYSVRVTFLSRVHIDWSEYGLCKDSMTGKYVPVLDRDALSLRNQTYRYGMQRLIGAGITKICPYDTNNFQGIFGGIPF